MNAEDKREQRLKLIEDHIGHALREAEQSGELRAAPSWGKPMPQMQGWDETPPELRVPFKILKDAGVVPPEVEWMRAIAQLQAEIDAAAPDDPLTPARRQRLVEMRQSLALRLERLARSPQL